MLELLGNQSKMEITLLVKSFLGLVFILAVLIFFLLYQAKQKKIIKNVPTKNSLKENSSDEHSLEYLLKIIKNRDTTAKELKNTLDLIIQYHGTIHPKLGLRPHPDFDIYGEILLRICRHPNTNKNIILDFDKALESRNEDYKKDINDFITKGLNSRGA